MYHHLKKVNSIKTWFLQLSISQSSESCTILLSAVLVMGYCKLAVLDKSSSLVHWQISHLSCFSPNSLLCQLCFQFSFLNSNKQHSYPPSSLLCLLFSSVVVLAIYFCCCGLSALTMLVLPRHCTALPQTPGLYPSLFYLWNIIHRLFCGQMTGKACGETLWFSSNS